MVDQTLQIKKKVRLSRILGEVVDGCGGGDNYDPTPTGRQVGRVLWGLVWEEVVKWKKKIRHFDFDLIRRGLSRRARSKSQPRY